MHYNRRADKCFLFSDLGLLEKAVRDLDRVASMFHYWLPTICHRSRFVCYALQAEKRNLGSRASNIAPTITSCWAWSRTCLWGDAKPPCHVDECAWLHAVIGITYRAILRSV